MDMIFGMGVDIDDSMPSSGKSRSKVKVKNPQKYAFSDMGPLVEYKKTTCDQQDYYKTEPVRTKSPDSLPLLPSNLPPGLLTCQKDVGPFSIPADN